MISLEDCIAMSGLSEDEILAIADHEHVSEAVACGLAQYLSQTPSGERTVRDMIFDDIRDAQSHGESDRVRHLLHVLHHYLKEHPGARPTVHPWSAMF